MAKSERLPSLVKDLLSGIFAISEGDTQQSGGQLKVTNFGSSAGLAAPFRVLCPAFRKASHWTSQRCFRRSYAICVPQHGRAKQHRRLAMLGLQRLR